MLSFVKRFFELIGCLSIIVFACMFCVIFIVFPITNFVIKPDVEMPAITLVLIIMVWLLAVFMLFTAITEAICRLISLFSGKFRVRLKLKNGKKNSLLGLKIPVLILFAFLIFCGAAAYLKNGMGIIFVFGFIQTIIIIVKSIKRT